jgi:hypothetical protein
LPASAGGGETVSAGVEGTTAISIKSVAADAASYQTADSTLGGAPGLRRGRCQLGQDDVSLSQGRRPARPIHGRQPDRACPAPGADLPTWTASRGCATTSPIAVSS